jgi:hypothetical protein
MRVFGHLVLFVCLAATIPLAQSPAVDAAAPVLAAAREALGGDTKLSAVSTMTATGRTRQVRGDNLVPIEFEILMQLPDKYVRRDEIPAQESGPTTVGFNGDELLQFPSLTIPQMQARAGGPPPPTAEQSGAAAKARLANVKQEFARLTLGLFAASFPAYPLTFTYAGKAEAPQGKADVLDVKGAPGPNAFSGRLFVNTETHLPIMVTWTAAPPPMRPPSRGAVPPVGAPASGAPPTPPGPPPESRLFFADYRQVSGIQLPFRLRRAVGPDTVEETTFDGFKINGKIDPKKFEVRK